MTFGKTLKQLRESNGYTMDKLIEIYNKRFNGKMNKSTLSRYENELQEPMYTVVLNLANIFNVSVDYLSGHYEVSDMKPYTTAQRLSQIIQSRNLKQVDILTAVQPYCNKFGVKLKKNHLSQYVSGKSIPRQDKLTVLGLALNVSEAWLMGYDVPMEREPQPPSPSLPSPNITENIVLITRRTGTQKKYTLSDRQTDVIEGMLEEFIPSTSPYGEIAAEGGELNYRKKKPETTL